MSNLSKKIALSLASLLLTLLAIEVGLRIGGYDLVVGDDMRFHPRLGWTMDPEGLALDQLNADGFRFSPVPIAKAAGVRRLLVLGDSFAAGSSFPYDLTFPGRLESWLSRDGQQWQVISLNAGDWGNAQQLLALREYGMPYQPDVVVLQLFPFNDLCNDGLEMADTCSLRDYQRPYLVPGPSGLELTYQYPIWGRLSRLSRLFGFAHNQILWELRTRRGLAQGNRAAESQFFRENSRRLGITYGGGALASLLPPSIQPPAVQAGWAQMRAIVGEIHQTVQQGGASLIGVVIPFAWTQPPYWENYGRHYAGADPENGTRQAEEFLRELGVPTVSLRHMVAARGNASEDCYLMPRDSHLNAYGHAAVAAWVIEAMGQAGVVPQPAEKLSVDFLDALAPDRSPPALFNFSGVRGGGGRYILGYAPEGRIVFTPPAAGRMVLTFEGVADVPDLRVRFQYTDANPGVYFTAKNKGDKVAGVVDFPVTSGRNSIKVTYSNWRGKDSENPFSYPVAVRFDKLQIQLH